MCSRQSKLNNVFPNSGAHNKQTGKYYITNFNNGEIEVYDKQLNHLTSITDDNANYVAVNEKTNKIYVSNYWDATVSVIDGKTDTIIGDPIPVGQPITPDDCYKKAHSSTYPFYPKCTNYNAFSASDGIAVDHETNRIFVTNVNDGTFVTIDGYTNKVVSKLELQEGIFLAATMPRRKIALALDWDRSTLSVLDENSGKITDAVQVGAADSPNCLRIQWDGGNCSFWGDLPSGVTVSADNQRIFVVDSGDLLNNSPATDPHADSRLVILEPTGENSRSD